MPDEALEAFRAALDLDSGFDTALHNRGTAFYALRRMDEAEEDFRAVLDRQADNADALTNLGAVLVKQNRPDDAADCFRRLRERAPYTYASSSSPVRVAVARFLNAVSDPQVDITFEPANTTKSKADGLGEGSLLDG